jgi:response regulator RpfG family c-di-GMP phosphodiesterase
MTDSSGRPVLVVEDDAKIAQLLVDYLRRDGFDASAVGDGNAALRLVQQSMPAALILDLMLPGLDGIAVCRAVRRFSDVPIVIDFEAAFVCQRGCNRSCAWHRIRGRRRAPIGCRLQTPKALLRRPLRCV